MLVNVWVSVKPTAALFNELKYSNSVLLTVPSAILLASIAAPDLILSFSILLNVLLSASIVLLVNVSVVALPTNVSSSVGNVTIPVFDIVAITGLVNVLLVNVCISVKPTAALSNDPKYSNSVLLTVPSAILLASIAAPALILSFSIFVTVLLSTSIVLFVNVSAVAKPTNVSVASGKVNVLSSVWLETRVIVLEAVAPSKSNSTDLLVFVVNLTFPVPFAVKLISIFESSPVAAKSGALDVSAFVTCNWFTAEVVVWNIICSLSFSSAI